MFLSLQRATTGTHSASPHTSSRLMLCFAVLALLAYFWRRWFDHGDHNATVDGRIQRTTTGTHFDQGTSYSTDP